MADDETTKLLNKFEFLANTIPKEKWGFQMDMMNALRDSRQKIVGEKVPKHIYNSLTSKQKMRLCNRLGPKMDNVLDIFSWAATSDFADAGIPKIMDPIGKRRIKLVEQSSEQSAEMSRIAAILLERGVRPRPGAEYLNGPPAAKRTKSDVEAGEKEKAAADAESADDEDFDAGSDSEDESGDEAVEDDEESASEVEQMEVDEPEEESVPVVAKSVTKKTAQPTPVKAKVIPEVAEDDDENEEEDDEENNDESEDEDAVATSKQSEDVENKEEGDTDSEEAEDTDSEEAVEESEEDEEVVVAPPPKTRSSAQIKVDTKPVKNEIKPKIEAKTIDEPTTDDFDFSLLKNSSIKPDHADKKKKKTKKEQRDTFKGRDYKALLQKVERRDERLQKIRDVNPEAAIAMENNIKFNKAIAQASGEKVKDNPELLKKGIKRKEKQKEKREKKWKKRVNTVKKAQAERQAKRAENIQKRKDTKKEHKIKRAKRKAKA